ncbi:hypothetical protein KEM55_006063 [Ascosphaera atra]|nr:hypothetical protein KEM55_006063 [Ascosphaera atra]
MLIAMLCNWSVRGHHHIKSMDQGQKVPFISDIGAFGLKPLFIAGAATSASMFTSVFVIERWMRHARQLAPNTNKREKIFACCSIFFAVMGACGIIFLSIFDTWNHNNVHDAMLVLFIVGYILSAVFICLEYYSLGLSYPEHRIIRFSFIIKAAFIVVEFTLAVAFASESRNGHRDVAGVLEWTVSFIYGFYVWSYILDLLPAVRYHHHIPQGQRRKEEMREAFAANGGDPTIRDSYVDSQRPNTIGSDRSQYEMAENGQRVSANLQQPAPVQPAYNPHTEHAGQSDGYATQHV